jgi:hypothetical protein
MKKPHAPLVMPGKIIALVKVVKDEQCQISPDKDEQERVEYIIDEIVRHLRRHYRPKQSQREVRIAVVGACGLLMQNVGVQPPKRKRSELPAKLQPAVIKKLTNDIRERADSLYRTLQDIPIELEMCVFDKSRGFDPLYAKEEFLERLERLRTITYCKPPLYDQVKESCADFACICANIQEFRQREPRKASFKKLLDFYMKLSARPMTARSSILSARAIEHCDGIDRLPEIHELGTDFAHWCHGSVPGARENCGLMRSNVIESECMDVFGTPI